jgi:cytochrome c peroxidase
MKNCLVLALIVVLSITSCQDNDEDYISTDQAILESVFGTNVNLDQPFNYQNTDIPQYIRFVNTGNAIENEKAVLGRVLFYDKQLSVDNSISCASCHQQENAFSDTNIASVGVNGVTGRHSMRLINVGFKTGAGFFWDKRVNSLEGQVIQPIQDHIEMGFSGEQGGPSFDDFLIKLSQIDYYKILFKHVYGDEAITDQRLQESLAQFVLSLQSFDSKYDEGLTATGDPGPPFPNYNMSENRGKFLFTTLPQNGGAGCVSCHAPPEFAIRGNSLNNGVIASISDPSVFDHSNTRSPTLRDIVNSNGDLNSPLMHNGSFSTLQEMIAHYDNIDITNQQSIDPLLLRGQGPNRTGQRLGLSNVDKIALEDFLKTLSGNDIYTNVKWSNPFED